MVKKLLCVCMSLVVIYWPNSALAAGSGLKTITAVQMLNNGGCLIYFDSEVHANCTTAGTRAVYVYPNKNGVTSEGLQSLVAITLSSFHSGTKVKVVFDETVPDCYVSQIIAYR